MEELKDYTLIIPTINRPKLLKRLILFLAYKSVKFSIIVVDSSEKNIISENKKNCEESGLNILHFDYPNDIEPVPKVLDGLGHVNTRYVSLCADDDLVFLEAIPECVRFLRENQDYIACHGYYLNIGKDDDRSYSIGLEYGGPSLDGERFEERVFQMLTNYQAISYAIFRTDVMTDYFKASIGIEPYVYIELFTGIIPLLCGKVKRLPVCYHVRTRQEAVSTHDNPRWHPFLWFADDPEGFLKEFVEYREILNTFITNKIGNRDERLDKMLLLLHSVYFMRCFDLHFIQRNVQNNLRIDAVRLSRDDMLFVRRLLNSAQSFFRKIFYKEYFVRRKSNGKSSITFKIPKKLTKSIVDTSVLNDLENYLLMLMRHDKA